MWYLLLLPLCLCLQDLEPPPPVLKTDSPTVKTGFVNVRLNHFDASNTDTFRLRFHYNDAHRSTDPPIVIILGGQWAISPSWVTGGLAHELAEMVRGTAFYVEHRYYGESRPGSNTSVPELRFLTVDQALADVAQFIQAVKSDGFDHGVYRNSKVVVLGCSYAGSMATWLRLTYPHLIDAAFSDGGPLVAREEFPEYLEIISEALRVHGGEQCVSSITEAITALEALLNTDNGPVAVQQMFNTCTPLQPSSPLDRATFYWRGITEVFATLVQYAPGDIAEACRVLTGGGETNPVQRLATFITSRQNPNSCLETRYSTIVAHHTDTSYDAPYAAMRLWTYQTCVQFGWYQTTASPRQPFLTSVPLEYFHQMCRDFYSDYFDESLLRAGIDRTNLFFGGLRLPDHVVSVAGGHDPWAQLGPNVTHARQSAPVFVVPEASRCMVIRPVGESQPPELKQVREQVIRTLYEWVMEHPIEASSAHDVVASTLLVLVGAFNVLI